MLGGSGRSSAPGLNQKGRASHAAPIPRSTPSRAGSHGKPRASLSLGILHQPAASVASLCPYHRRRSCRRGTAARPGAAFTFLLRAHLSAELSAAPVIGPRRSLVLGVNTAESEKTRAELSPGASSKAAKYQRTRGVGGMPSLPPPRFPITPCYEPRKVPGKDARWQRRSPASQGYGDAVGCCWNEMLGMWD